MNKFWKALKRYLVQLIGSGDALNVESKLPTDLTSSDTDNICISVRSNSFVTNVSSGQKVTLIWRSTCRECIKKRLIKESILVWPVWEVLLKYEKLNDAQTSTQHLKPPTGHTSYWHYNVYLKFLDVDSIHQYLFKELSGLLGFAGLIVSNLRPCFHIRKSVNWLFLFEQKPKPNFIQFTIH